MWTSEEQQMIDETARNMELYKKWNQIYSWTVESAEKTFLNTTSMSERYSDGPLRHLYRKKPQRFTLKEMYADIPGFWDFAETLSIEQFRLCKEYYLMHKETLRLMGNPLGHIKQLMQENRIRSAIISGLRFCKDENTLDN